MTTESDQQFFARFLDCDLESLSHRDHVRLAWIILQEQPLERAVETLRLGFKAFAISKGKPDLYHETITWAFTVLIHQRIKSGLSGATWQQFLALNPDLDTGVAALGCCYSKEILDSDLARKVFVLPSRTLQEQNKKETAG